MVEVASRPRGLANGVNSGDDRTRYTVVASAQRVLVRRIVRVTNVHRTNLHHDEHHRAVDYDRSVGRLGQHHIDDVMAWETTSCLTERQTFSPYCRHHSI